MRPCRAQRGSERDNVAMSTTRHELLHAFDLLLAPSRFKDYGPNGLQVEGRTVVRKIVSGVTARPTPSLSTMACSGAARTAASPAG
jgi:hypothetical protein